MRTGFLRHCFARGRELIVYGPHFGLLRFIVFKNYKYIIAFLHCHSVIVKGQPCCYYRWLLWGLYSVEYDSIELWSLLENLGFKLDFLLRYYKILCLQRYRYFIHRKYVFIQSFLLDLSLILEVLPFRAHCSDILLLLHIIAAQMLEECLPAFVPGFPSYLQFLEEGHFRNIVLSLHNIVVKVLLIQRGSLDVGHRIENNITVAIVGEVMAEGLPAGWLGLCNVKGKLLLLVHGH